MADRIKSSAIRASHLRRSAIRTLFDAADQRPGTIRLEVGEPSFNTPAHIIEAAKKAAADGFTHYGPNGGLHSLRELLAEKISKVDGYTAGVDEIVVTPGAMNALFSAYLALVDVGDEVLLPTPGYPNMDEMVRLVGGVPVFYTLRPENGYLPDVDEISSLVTQRTKVIFANSPSNPTGAVFPESLIEALVRLSDREGFWLISDEVYDELILDDGVPHVSASSIIGSNNIISVYSFSKIYAMTGWRVGYAVAPPPLADVLRRLQEPQVSCPSTISQKAAEAALLGPKDEIEAMRQAYIQRRDLAWAVSDRLGLKSFRPVGTFYMVFDISDSSLSSMDFAFKLLDDHGVSVAPGDVFGPGGSRLVRISLANDGAAIQAGIEAIATGLRD